MPAFGCAEIFFRVRRHLLDRVEDRLRAHRAVQAEHVGAEPVERARHVLRRRAVRCEAVHADRHLRHHGHRGIHIARRGDRLADLVQVAEGLEDEQVGAALLQSLHLLAKDLARFFGRGRTIRLEPDAERPDGSRDEDVVSLLGRFTRDLRGTPVQLVRLRREPERGELDPIRAEAVRLEHLGTRLHVRAMHVAHEVRRAEVQLVVALVDEDAPGVQHRAHGAVEEDERLGIDQP